MANDRLVIRCKKCKKPHVIWAHQPGTWPLKMGDAAPCDIGEFTTKHMRMCWEEMHYSMSFSGESCFDIGAESDSGFEYNYD